MRNWRDTLAALVAVDREQAPFPLLVYEAHQPKAVKWPRGLPSHPAILDFYRICDGGVLGPHWVLPTVGAISALNASWRRNLRKYDERGDVLDPRTHLVLAEDAGGCPIVYNAATQAVAAFQADGGDWEPPIAGGPEAFYSWIFNEAPLGDEAWAEALRQLESASA